MQSRKKHRWLLLCACMSVMLFTGVLSARAQSNIPNALDSFDGLDDSVWEQVSAPGFGDSNNFSVVAMAEYNGRLYAMTRNQSAGAEIWRTSGTDWEQVLFPGGETNGIYGNPWINNVWGRMIVFNGKLYIGFSSGLQGNYLGSTGCEIWRYDGATWEPVISDKRAVDQTGSITAISDCAASDGNVIAYFDDSSKAWTANQWAGGVLTITSGTGKYRKFIITANTATQLTVQQNETAGTLSGGSAETEFTVCSQRTYNNPFPMYSYTLGAIETGSTYEINMGWEQNGFGNPWNKTITAMVEFDGKLYVSTGLNYEYGGQVWYTADGDTWQVTTSVLGTGDYKNSSFGNYHTSASYPGSNKPVSSSVTDLVVSSISGTPVLYAGGTGTSGDKGGCSRMARLTASGWELIVDNAVDTANTTGSNENGFGSPSTCGTNQFNFMPWSLADFMGDLMVGISGEGARVLRAPALTGTQTIRDDGRWAYTVGTGNVASGYTDTLPVSIYPNGFDGYKYPDGNYQNLAVNLFPFGNTLFGGIITQYVPEYSIPPNMADLHGAQIWRSPNGMTWKQVTADGFGDSDTIMFEAFAVFNGTLYVSGSKGASSTPSGLGGAKIYRLAYDGPCVAIEADQPLVDKFERFTVTGITTPLPGPDPNPPGYLGAAFLRAGDLDGDGQKEIVVTSGTGLSGSAFIKDSTVAVFKRTSQDLSTWTQAIIRSDFAFANDVVIRDVDYDGEVDIMVFDNFLGGAYTNFPAAIYLLKNLGGSVTDPNNWQKITIYSKNPAEAGIDAYEKAKRRGSYHQAYFLDLDGDGREDFVTTRISMEIWQARADQTLLYGKQYMWIEWFKAETDLVTYPTGFSGPYDIGDGAGFLMGMHDVDGDGLSDILAPQFFIGVAGSLVIKGSPDGSDPYGDSLAWFKNPGPAAMAADRNYEWERHTIDNWYTSPNPMGKGFMAFPAEINGDGNDELIFTSHNHQESVAGKRVWPSGVYYLEIPDDPYDTANWSPVTIDAGDAFTVSRPGGPYSQGSPGMAAAGDVGGDSANDLVVAGDGHGSLYYYENVNNDGGGCDMKFKRTALYSDPASMPAEIKLYDMDDDGQLEILATVYDTSLAKNSSSGSVFIWKRTGCSADIECADSLHCNGQETCVEGACAAGSPPCSAEEFCNEDAQRCDECLGNEDCPEGYECNTGVGECVPVIADDPPSLGDGPHIAAGWWPLLSTSHASPTYLRQNTSLLWTFSDDFASCSGECTHTAEYSKPGDLSWTSLSVSSDAAQGYASVALPITGLQNATTYAFRFSVTDCASQTTQSQTYYFRVAVSDALPQVTAGPFLAAGAWPRLARSEQGAWALRQDSNVLWTFSDDYASCGGPVTHRAWYRLVGEEAWTSLAVSTDPEGTSYAYVTLPVSGLSAGTYQLLFDVRDCAGQYRTPGYYYFKVE